MNTIIRNRPYYKGVTREFESPIHSTKLKYEPGTTVEADGLATDPSEACGQGINFCNTIAEALRFGPVVVEVTVLDGQDIIDAGAKLRAKSVVVGGVVNLTEADLTGADLYGAHLTEANLRGADLYGANLNDETTIALPDGWRIENGKIVAALNLSEGTEEEA